MTSACTNMRAELPLLGFAQRKDSGRFSHGLHGLRGFEVVRRPFYSSIRVIRAIRG